MRRRSGARPARTRFSAQERLQAILQRRAPIYDKSQDGHYNLISALHKSVRGSDPQASLYYFCRMLDGGEDPMYLARRLIRMASEDIGLADHNALVVCNAARDAYHMLGTPEGELALAEAAVYLAIGAEIERALHGLRSGHAGRQGRRLAAAAEAHPERADEADEVGRLRLAATSTTTTRENAFSGQDYFPDGAAAAGVLPADRARLRKAHRRAHGGMGAAERQRSARGG